MASKIIGCGSYLPKRIVTNQDLTHLIDTSDEWIRSRTGINQRHIAAEDEYTSHVALEAARSAILNSNIDSAIIDLIIVCTTTPDNVFPSVANKLQGYLGLGSIPSFDLQAVCAGFIYGLNVADNLIKSGAYNTILLVGAEKMSSIINWEDRSTSILFGDGGGAVILQKDEGNSGVIDSKIYSDGTLYDVLYTTIGNEFESNERAQIKMKGQELFRHAVEKMSESIVNLLEKNNINISDIDYFVPHQANIRIINSLAERLNFDQNKVVKTVSNHANCSAASIPLALYELNVSGNLKRGDLILFAAIGAGLSWGSAILRW
jgi:3-oxoacyl-[acyl-carrier-protein] synthase-3